LCFLHLHKRIIEKLVTLLFTQSLDELVSKMKCIIKNGDEAGDASFTDGQAKNVEEKLAEIIDKALTLEESRATDWTENC
jgi:phosphomevalonate kinase